MWIEGINGWVNTDVAPSMTKKKNGKNVDYTETPEEAYSVFIGDVEIDDNCTIEDADKLMVAIADRIANAEMAKHLRMDEETCTFHNGASKDDFCVRNNDLFDF